jgi:UDP-N-acetylmuramyl pentapeptide synthase
MRDFAKRCVIAIITLEARCLLRRHNPRIIAITGSVGKTAMKDAVYAALRRQSFVRKSEKSYNSEIGVPLSVLGLENAWDNPFLWIKNMIDGAFIALFSKNYPDTLIIEAGIDRPGDMARLVNWLKPDIAVITRIPDVPVHVEFFPSPDEMAREKLLLAETLPENGVLVYNHDDTRLCEYALTTRRVAVGYSRTVPSHFTASNDRIVYHDDRPVGIACDVTHLDTTVSVHLKGVLGVQYCYTIAGALAVAAQCGLSLEEGAAELVSYQPPPGRMRLIPGVKGTLLIDDSYNSSPAAAEAALVALKEVQYAKRKIAVLGDMLELGRYSPGEHTRIGELVPTSADLLVAIGIRSRKTAEAALTHGLSEKNILQYDDAGSAGRELQNLIAPGDVILIKGSQGMRLERLVEELMAEPERAGELLVRQDAAWQNR